MGIRGRYTDNPAGTTSRPDKHGDVCMVYSYGGVWTADCKYFLGDRDGSGYPIPSISTRKEACWRTTGVGIDDMER